MVIIIVFSMYSTVKWSLVRKRVFRYLRIFNLLEMLRLIVRHAHDGIFRTVRMLNTVWCSRSVTFWYGSGSGSRSWSFHHWTWTKNNFFQLFIFGYIYIIRIKEALKHLDPTDTDPDPQYWILWMLSAPAGCSKMVKKGIMFRIPWMIDMPMSL